LLEHVADKVEIFNMRGRKVFEASNMGGISITWTGKESGQMVESGVYLARLGPIPPGPYGEGFLAPRAQYFGAGFE